MARVGFGEVVITPSDPVGLPLGGYGNRREGCTGVHDDIYARALYVQGDRTGHVLLVTLDLIGLSDKRVALVKRAICRACPALTPAEIFVNANHTHSAWESLGVLGPGKVVIDGMLRVRFDVAVFRELVDRLVQLTREVTAPGTLVPARLGIGKVPLGHLVVNRRASRRPLRQALGVIKVETPTGVLLGAYMNFGAHGTLLGARNCAQSAEWMGAAVKYFRQLLQSPASKHASGAGAGAGAKPRSESEPFALFAVGAQGNVKPVLPAPLRAEARAELPALPRDAFWAVEAYGWLVARAAVALLPTISCRPVSRVQAVTRRLSIPFGPIPRGPGLKARLRYCLEKLKMRVLLAFLHGVHGGDPALTHYEKTPGGWALQTIVHAVALDDVLVLGAPGEIFTGLVEWVFASLPAGVPARTLVVGLTNDYASYLFPRAEYFRGGYETQFQVAPWAGEAVARVMLLLARRLLA